MLHHLVVVVVAVAVVVVVVVTVGVGEAVVKIIINHREVISISQKTKRSGINNIARQGKEQFQPHANYENKCYKCGMKGHWSHTCYTADHLVKLYQTSLNEKGKEKIETNLINGDNPVDITHLDVSYFFEDPNGKIDQLIGDGNVHIN